MGENKDCIVIVNQDSGYLMIDIANAFVEKGYKVSLITGRLVKRNKSLHPSIKVSKIISYNRNSTVKRLSTWGFGFVQILFLLWFQHRNKKLLLVSNPPFTSFVPLCTKNHFSLLIYDIYPDALVEYKIFKNESYLIQQWKKVNAKVFDKAEHIYTLNASMKTVLEKYGSKEKIKVIPIWTDNTFLKPIPKNENAFIKEHHLEHKFIVQYSGNLGKTHPVEKILDVAEILKEDPFFFLIIGGGEKFKLIESEIKKRKLQNTLLLPWQPSDKIPLSLAAADIGVVTLGAEASNLSIPSKTYNLMSVGVPIISIAAKDSALANLIKGREIGANFEINDISGIKEFIQSLHRDNVKLKNYGTNSLKISQNYSPENAYKFDI